MIALNSINCCLVFYLLIVVIYGNKIKQNKIKKERLEKVKIFRKWAESYGSKLNNIHWPGLFFALLLRKKTK